MNDNYVQQNADTTPVFKNIFTTAQRLIDRGTLAGLKVLIYNGDAGK
jgi:hypothetical protein